MCVHNNAEVKRDEYKDLRVKSFAHRRHSFKCTFQIATLSIRRHII